LTGIFLLSFTAKTPAKRETPPKGGASLEGLLQFVGVVDFLHRCGAISNSDGPTWCAA